MDIKFSGSDAGGFQFDPNAAPKPKRERKPRKSIGSKGGRIAVNTLVTLLVGAVFFYVQMPAINLHAEEFYGFVLLLCVSSPPALRARGPRATSRSSKSSAPCPLSSWR